MSCFGASLLSFDFLIVSYLMFLVIAIDWAGYGHAGLLCSSWIRIYILHILVHLCLKPMFLRTFIYLQILCVAYES